MYFKLYIACVTGVERGQASYTEFLKINAPSDSSGPRLPTCGAGKDSRRSGMYQIYAKIGHAKSVGFRFYSAI